MTNPDPQQVFLLDVNVLVALAWPHHPFHGVATHFLEDCPAWATCAITQLGFLRISLNPAVTNVKVTAQDAVGLLSRMTSDRAHRYLEGAPQPVKFPQDFERVLGHRQVTDAYLLRLAAHHGAQFLTLDTRLRKLPGVVLLLEQA